MISKHANLIRSYDKARPRGADCPETGLIQEKVQEVVQKTFDYISEAVTQGTTVELRNFGVFGSQGPEGADWAESQSS